MSEGISLMIIKKLVLMKMGIANLFDLGYSSISRRVTIPRQKLSRTSMKSKMSGKDEINKQLEII
jgi:hypothetical protein